jgi:hypothetical protein
MHHTSLGAWINGLPHNIFKLASNRICGTASVGSVILYIPFRVSRQTFLLGEQHGKIHPSFTQQRIHKKFAMTVGSISSLQYFFCTWNIFLLF